jgi:predicted P-loop ATPase/GTPase
VVEERVVTVSETAAVVFKGRRRYRRIAESRVALDIRWFSLVNIAPCSCESIVKTLARNLRVIWRRRRLGIYRAWMRTSRQ